VFKKPIVFTKEIEEHQKGKQETEVFQKIKNRFRNVDCFYYRYKGKDDKRYEQ
jgi:hypothetical protein